MSTAASPKANEAGTPLAGTRADTPLVGLVMGSDSDWPVMKAAAEVCSEFEIFCEAKVISAHRTPQDLEAFKLAFVAARKF